jgi:hypothetical protein
MNRSSLLLIVLFWGMLFGTMQVAVFAGEASQEQETPPPPPVYDLTEVDLFSLAPDVKGAQIKVLGIGLDDPVKQVLAKFNLKKSHINKSGEKDGKHFLWIKPGFKIRIYKKRVDALIIDPLFRKYLVGEVKNVFDHIENDIKLRMYLKKVFRKHETVRNAYYFSYNWDVLVYKQGISFARRFNPVDGYGIYIVIEHASPLMD